LSNTVFIYMITDLIITQSKIHSSQAGEALQFLKGIADRTRDETID